MFYCDVYFEVWIWPNQIGRKMITEQLKIKIMISCGLYKIQDKSWVNGLIGLRGLPTSKHVMSKIISVTMIGGCRVKVRCGPF